MNKILIVIAMAITHNILFTSYYFMNYFKSQVWFLMGISKIVDKRKHTNIGYFISAKYENMISDILKTIERQEKISKLNKIKKHQDIDFLETGVSDGL